MPEERLMFYNHTLTHNIRCTGCGKVVGPEVGVRTILEIRDGPITGYFHNKDCYERTREKIKDEEI